VSRAIQNTYGIKVWGNGNQIDDNLPRSHFKQVNLSLAEALKIPGLILTWEKTSTRLGKIYGHTAITAGDGRGSYSDYIESNTLAVGGRSGLKVFMPLDGSVSVPASAPAPASSGTPTRKSGAKGEAVKKLQTLLGQAGFACGVDGSFGPKTLEAVKAFQKARGLAADGVVGPKTWQALNTPAVVTPPATPPSTGTPVLKSGAKGEALKKLQTLHTQAGFSCSVDGSFGPKTLEAVKAFQSARGLAADGVVGPKTWEALNTPAPVTPPVTPPTPPSTETPTLKNGAKGEAVKTLQTLLTQAGFSCAVDGSFGPATASAVMAYQRSRGLSVDGVVGPATWKALQTGAPAVAIPEAPADLQKPVTTGQSSTNLRTTHRSMPVDAPIRSTAGNRSASLYSQVVRQFDVENNPRHLKANGNTYCNIFMWDVMRAMDVQLPHWVDAKGLPTAYNAPGSHELNANATCNWLEQHGPEYGWKKVSMTEASAYANAGKPAVLVWKNPNPSKSGHVGVVIPSTDGKTHIAQAGGTNTNDRIIKEGSTFGTAGKVGTDVYFWVHE